jgi:hypothetical protein
MMAYSRPQIAVIVLALTAAALFGFAVAWFGTQL